jgi:hypothetical protein
MDQASFEYWNMNGCEELLEQLDQGEEIVKVNLPGRKKNKNKRRFYTFIGGDAVDAIKQGFLSRSP